VKIGKGDESALEAESVVGVFAGFIAGFAAIERVWNGLRKGQMGGDGERTTRNEGRMACVLAANLCIFPPRGVPGEIAKVGAASACGRAVGDSRWMHASGDREIEKFSSVCGGEVD
jgi:hypothetical protein